MEAKEIEKEEEDKKSGSEEGENGADLAESIAASEERRLKLIKQQQKEALDKLRQEQNEKIGRESEQDKATRLKALMEQSELFSHFITGGKRREIESGPKSPNKRGRKGEKEEDEMLIQTTLAEEKGESQTTRITVTPNFILGGEMRPYQLHGLNWLIKLYDNRINGILADEMGLGKTLQTISLLGYLKHFRNIHGPHLVVCPKSTLLNWIKEFNRWCPSIKVVKLHGSKEERANQIQHSLVAGKFDVCCTTYEVAIIEKSALLKFKWRYLIIDEAHRIKNEQSVLSKVVRLYHSQHRLLITGTPLQNNLHELWALLNFLLPELFKDAADFEEWFDVTDEDNKTEMVEKLHKVLKPFLLRRLKSEVEVSLPPKKETKLYIGMTDMQREWYKKILARDIHIINAGNSKEGRMRLLNIVMQLRKCCNHPYLFQGAEPGPPYTNGEHLITNSGKMVLLDKLLQKLKENGSRVLIFSQMTRVLDILEDYCLWREIDFCRIDGSTQSDERELQIEEFNKENSEKFVFLLSTRAGGLGINLATANIVILFDSDWNPQVDLQAQDRAHRIGQKKAVHVYRFITENSIEEKIIERAERKLYLDALVIQQGRLVQEHKPASREELMSMIRFGADLAFSAKGATVTDEDIEAIISRGQERTDKDNEKLKELANTLLSFSATGEEKNIYNFMGVDYSNKNAIVPSAPQFIDIGQRERKLRSYDEEAYYRELLRSNANKDKKKALPRPPKQITIHDFQFYPLPLNDLLEKETLAWRYKIKQETGKDPMIRGEEDKAEYEDQPEPLNEDVEYPELTDAEEKKKEKMMTKGFANWNKRDLYAFVKACATYGRDSAEVLREVPNKTPEEVKEYSAVFWKRYKEIEDWERHIKYIEQGEEKLQRKSSMIAALDRKFKSCRNPWNDMQIQYTQSKGKQFTEEEDRFIICMTHQLGYGNWDEMLEVIRNSWQFRFDWFIKSRTAIELNRRADSLIRMIEKEYEIQEEDEPKRKAKVIPKKPEKVEANNASKQKRTTEKEPKVSKKRKSS